MNLSRLFAIATLLALAAIACDNKPAETPSGPGPVNSSNLPGGPINTGGGPSGMDGGK